MRGCARLYAGLLLGRVGATMWLLILVLFVLGRYHSPQLAGITAFLAILPGLLLAPLAGALLDRHGRAPLVVADYLIAALAAGLIAALSALHALPPPVLLTIVTLASLTNPLSGAGARSLFPTLVPRPLWERANALDSSGHVIATLVAAPLAGTLVGLAGGALALAAAGALFLAAAIAMLRLPEHDWRQREGFALTDHGMNAQQALDQVNYCIWCHTQGKDSCSSGLKDRKTGAYQKSVFGVTLAGCPLDEKISELNEVTPGHAILSSNTSSLSITEMGEATSRPEKVVGFHFFYPASVMRLIEVIEGEDTSPETAQAAYNFAQAICSP